MKSRLEVRKFAIESAVAIIGSGTPSKDVVEKAKEIEAYIIGEAILPETYDDVNAITGLANGLFSAITEDKTKKK